MRNGEDNPDKIILGDPEPAPESDAVITVYVSNQRFVVTPTEALSIMNQISGVLLAYGYSRGREQGQKKYAGALRTEESEDIRIKS